MEHPWLFYVLFFIFGHATCRLFYFLNASRRSIRILQLTQVVSLFIITKALESFHYARDYRIRVMKEEGESDHNINALTIRFGEETEFYKRRAILQIIDAHGGFFSEAVDFIDWKSAMVFLENNRDTVMEFLTKDEQ